MEKKGIISNIGRAANIPENRNAIKKLPVLLYIRPANAEPNIIPNSRKIKSVPKAFPFNPGKARSADHANKEGEINPKPNPNNTDEII